MTTSPLPSNDDIPKDELARARRAKAPAAPKLTNKQFARLTPAKKRVAIARDVLEWLATKRLRPRSGVYITVYDAPTPPVVDADKVKVPLTTMDDINGYSCKACALGSVFALMSFRCGLSVGDAANDLKPINEAMHEQLAPFFSGSQLAQIECAFEVSTGFSYLTLSVAQANAAKNFGSAIEETISRLRSSGDGDDWNTSCCWDTRDSRVMRAVMQNIIDNDGTFVP